MTKVVESSDQQIKQSRLSFPISLTNQ